MKGYKAFEPGMICKGKQYAENTVFEEDSAVVCESGMHFCKNPFNVLDHYALVSGSGEIPDFAEVEALEKPNTGTEVIGTALQWRRELCVAKARRRKAS